MVERRSKKRLSGFAVAALAGLALASGANGAEDKPAELPPPDGLNAHWELLGNFCTECHNYMDWAGEVAFDTMTPEGVPDNAETWEAAVRKLEGGLMPPPGNPRPADEKIDAFTETLKTYLDKAAAAKGPRPGDVGLHRLNRREYENAVWDLLNAKIDAAALLPQDAKKDGYDNIASVLQVSPTFMEQYVAAAREVAIKAVGDPAPRAGSTTYVNESEGLYNRHVEGLPLGTRGGFVVEHHFPADGTYQINIEDMAVALWVYNMEFENTVLVTLDGRPVYRTKIGGEEDMKAIDQNGVSAVGHINQRLKNIRFKATAGPHDIGVTFLARPFAESDDRLKLPVPGGGQDRLLQVSSFELRGPFNPTGLSETPSRKRIFSCHPQNGADAEACAEEILSRLARRAYRRPVTDADMAGLMAFYEKGREGGSFDTGIRKALTAILASPDFLYRIAPPPDDVKPGEIYALDDLELASRLSFFLWSSIPDKELLKVAEEGRLSDPQVLQDQIARMLADPRSESLVTNFAFQWLDVARMDEIDPDPTIFPYAADTGNSNRSANGSPKDDFRTELRLFIDSILRRDRNVLELLTADHTYLNERLALLYGIREVKGDQFRRVELSDPARFGLLGKGGILLASSYPNRTAPVLRGKFILENLMGAPPEPPPPGVDTDLEVNDGEEAKTVRERLAEHREKPSCNMCHGVMDPLGLALENFNAVGKWREKDRFTGKTIDARGELPNGTQLHGPADIRAALLEKPERFVRTLTEELMTYALGRSVKYFDMPTVRAIVDQAAKDDYRFSAIVKGIIESEAFRMRRLPSEDTVQAMKEAAVHD